MPIYAYRDHTNAHDFESRVHGLTDCPDHPHARVTRVYQVQFKRVWQEGWNPAVNAPISDQRQFERELAKKSEIASESTGIPHNFQPCDWAELAPPEST